MISERLARYMDEVTPPINPDTANGLAVIQLEPNRVLKMLETVQRNAAKSFPPGLTFVGVERVYPEEEYRMSTAQRSSKRMFDIAPTDIYPIRFRFEYEGEPLQPRYIYVPFCRQAGQMYFNGAKYMLAPVHNDIVFSVSHNSIFVRFLRDKITFERLDYGYMTSGGRTELQHVVFAPIYRGKGTARPVKAKTCMMHYLLCKFGFEQTWKQFAGFVPEYGDESTINEASHPSKDWVVAYSRAIKPRVINNAAWTVPTLRLAIPREYYTQNVKLMLAGFFYIVDHFPHRTTPRWIESAKGDRDTYIWRIFLGHMNLEPGHSEIAMMEKMTSHIRSVDDYVDGFVTRQLREIGHDVSDTYDLLNLIMLRFSDWLNESVQNINSMYGKELNIPYFLLFNITRAMFDTMYELNQRLNIRRSLSAKDIENIFNSKFFPNLFKRANRTCGAMINEPVANDNMAIRLTQIIVPQNKSDKSRPTSKTVDLNHASLKLHPSLASVGAYRNPPKSAPRGDARWNHHCPLDSTFRIQEDPELKPLLDQTNHLITRGYVPDQS